MGELIAFKPAKSGMRLRAAPADHATIVVFTGVFQERLDAQEPAAERQRQAKRTRRVSGKRTKKRDGQQGGPGE